MFTLTWEKHFDFSGDFRIISFGFPTWFHFVHIFKAMEGAIHFLVIIVTIHFKAFFIF